MKKLILIAILATIPTFALADPLQQYLPGFRTIDGSQLNKMVNVVNGLSGNGGTPQKGYFSLNTATSGPTPATGTVIQAVGADAAIGRIEIDAFGNIPVFTARRADGTKASPTPVVSTDEIGSFNFHGATSTTAYGPGARFSAFATENWSGTASGTKLIFSTTPNTTQTLTDAIVIDQDQSLNGATATFAVKGLAAAQGGAISITGGTSSTSANAGGAVSATGGTPGLTGVGGAVTFAAGLGGATSGAGGVASLTGGAGTAGNSAGGIVKITGGAGQGSAAGGKAQVIGGAGGATGLGGVAEVTAGSPTSGNGSNVTITASAGAGGTNAGGSVNLVPGAAVSTGIPGTIQVNGNSDLICSTYYFTGTPAATNQVFFIATRPLLMTSISQVHSTAAGGASTLDITKDTGTTAPAGGTALTTAAFNLNATANTVQSGALTATVATKTLAAGDRLSVKYNNTIQSSAGVVVTACMAPL